MSAWVARVFAGWVAGARCLCLAFALGLPVTAGRLPPVVGAYRLATSIDQA